MLNRREVMIGSAALSVVGPAMVEAAIASPVLPSIGVEKTAAALWHPFLGIQDVADGFFQRLRVWPVMMLVNDGKKHWEQRWDCGILKYKANIAVSSLDEAENVFLGRLEQLEIPFSSTFDTRNDFPDRYDGYFALAILINRVANLIAARTRRGAGNVCLMHPDNVRYLQESRVSAFSPLDDRVDRDWKRVGRLNESIDVWTGERIPLDRLYVLYVGSGVSGIDTGFFVDATGKHMLIDDAALDYVGVVGIAKFDESLSRL